MAYTRGNHTELLEAALIGYQHQLATIDERMAEIRRELSGEAGSPATATTSATMGKRRRVSEETRARMAAAQQRRWAGAKRAGTPARKRKMSAEGKARIAEATRKRWEAYRAAKAVQTK